MLEITNASPKRWMFSCDGETIGSEFENTYLSTQNLVCFVSWKLDAFSWKDLRRSRYAVHWSLVVFGIFTGSSYVDICTFDDMFAIWTMKAFFCQVVCWYTIWKFYIKVFLNFFCEQNSQNDLLFYIDLYVHSFFRLVVSYFGIIF